MSEHALRQAWRRADSEVAKSLAALCYGKAPGTRDAKLLSQSAMLATRQRRDLAACLAERAVPPPGPARENDVPARPVAQISQATGQTRALRPSTEPSMLSQLRQRLSAA